MMKRHSVYLLLNILFLLSCNQSNNKSNSITDYYSTENDTVYDTSDRTKISNIKRVIYNKTSKDYKRSLIFKRDLTDNESIEFYLMRINTSNLDNIRTESLGFDNVSEVKDLFTKIDSLDNGQSLMERKKTIHYEIKKSNGGVDIKQFSSGINIANNFYLLTSEYEGIKYAFEKYLAETN